MGREWLYKASGSSQSSAAAARTVNRKTAKDKLVKNSSSSSCMSAIFNQFRFHHPSFLSQSTVSIGDESSCVQGIEAPRNSLESPESATNVVSSSSEVKEHMKLNMGRILQIKTKRSTTFTNDLSSENCISPATKTPNLVARLMGLPEYSSSSHHHTRSLPSTPRLSTASRSSTDYHHRLSLQIHKENNSQQHIKTTPRRSERTSRRFGTDITNTISPARRDSNLDLVISPKLRLLDIKNNLKKPVLSEVKSKSHSHSHSPPRRLRQRPAAMKPENVVKDEMIKSIQCERYDLRVKKMKQEVCVSVRKNKSTKLPKHVFNKSSSSTTTRLSQKQVSLPSKYLNSSYTTNDTHNLKAASTTTISFNKLRQPTVSTRRRRMIMNNKFEEEVEDIVVEIESEIMGKLVHEIIAVAPAGSDRLRSHVLFT